MSKYTVTSKQYLSLIIMMIIQTTMHVTPIAVPMMMPRSRSFKAFADGSLVTASSAKNIKKQIEPNGSHVQLWKRQLPGP